MNISETGLGLIRKWEGCELTAYLDPVGIPTIGYGAITFPGGDPVRLGDRITQEQAEAMLLQECAEVCRTVSALVRVDINQNQFDALVSLTYNIGAGAFGESTLLRRLNSGAFEAAAEQFPVWNKGTIRGVKQEIPGLTNRRKDEKKLFESSDPPGLPIELDHEPTPQQQASWLEAYDDQGRTIIVAWKGSQVVEILSLASPLKHVLIEAISQYPNAANLLIAPAGKSIPDGPRIEVTECRPVSISETVTTPPAAPTRILVRGSQGEEVDILQQRLQDLGYYSGPINGVFDSGTDAAARRFQAVVFGTSEADGKVGPITWDALWQSSSVQPAPAPPAPAPGVPGRTYLRLTKTPRRDPDGLTVLLLEYIRNGVVEGSLHVCSGAPGCQSFRSGSQSRSGSFEPLPEGKWYVNDICWCDGKDNYHGNVYASGLGPVSIPIDYVAPGSTQRSAIEIHIDWNKNSGAPGTAGCIGINSISDYRILVSWLRETDPRDLFVDWGLGTCPRP